MKKLLSIFLVVFLISSLSALVTACGNEQAETPEESTSSIAYVPRSSSKDAKSSVSVLVPEASPSANDPEPSQPSISEQEPTLSVDPQPSVPDAPASSEETPSISSEDPSSNVEQTSSIDPNAAILVTSEASAKNGLYISQLRVVNAGTYLIGGEASNYIYGVEIVTNGSTYFLDAGTLATFEKTLADGETGTYADGYSIPCGTNNYFTLICKGAKTAVNANAKTFADTKSFANRINFGGKTEVSATYGAYVNGIKFTCNGVAEIKVWWVAGDIGRQVQIYQETNTPTSSVETPSISIEDPSSSEDPAPSSPSQPTSSEEAPSISTEDPTSSEDPAPSSPSQPSSSEEAPSISIEDPASSEDPAPSSPSQPSSSEEPQPTVPTIIYDLNNTADQAKLSFDNNGTTYTQVFGSGFATITAKGSSGKTTYIYTNDSIANITSISVDIKGSNASNTSTKFGIQVKVNGTWTDVVATNNIKTVTGQSTVANDTLYTVKKELSQQLTGEIRFVVTIGSSTNKTFSIGNIKVTYSE